MGKTSSNAKRIYKSQSLFPLQWYTNTHTYTHTCMNAVYSPLRHAACIHSHRLFYPLLCITVIIPSSVDCFSTSPVFFKLSRWLNDLLKKNVVYSIDIPWYSYQFKFSAYGNLYFLCFVFIHILQRSSSGNIAHAKAFPLWQCRAVFLRT